jgi:hypothetical protein
LAAAGNVRDRKVEEAERKIVIAAWGLRSVGREAVTRRQRVVIVDGRARTSKHPDPKSHQRIVTGTRTL